MEWLVHIINKNLQFMQLSPSCAPAVGLLFCCYSRFTVSSMDGFVWGDVQ